MLTQHQSWLSIGMRAGIYIVYRSYLLRQLPGVTTRGGPAHIMTNSSGTASTSPAARYHVALPCPLWYTQGGAAWRTVVHIRCGVVWRDYPSTGRGTEKETKSTEHRIVCTLLGFGRPKWCLRQNACFLPPINLELRVRCAKAAVKGAHFHSLGPLF